MEESDFFFIPSASIMPGQWRLDACLLKATPPVRWSFPCSDSLGSGRHTLSLHLQVPAITGLRDASYFSSGFSLHCIHTFIKSPCIKLSSIIPCKCTFCF